MTDFLMSRACTVRDSALRPRKTFQNTTPLLTGIFRATSNKKKEVYSPADRVPSTTNLTSAVKTNVLKQSTTPCPLVLAEAIRRVLSA
jgi:hypothetical protein